MEQHDRTQSHARSLAGLFESAKAQVNALQEEVSQLSAELQISQATAEELEAVGDRLAATHALTRHMLQEAEARSLQLEQGQVLAPFRSKMHQDSAPHLTFLISVICRYHGLCDVLEPILGPGLLDAEIASNAVSRFVIQQSHYQQQIEKQQTALRVLSDKLSEANRRVCL